MQAIRISLAAAIMALIGTGCQNSHYEPPMRGWTCLPTLGGCNEYGNSLNTTAYGTVGLPFKWSIQAGCNTETWRMGGMSVATGRLPPGLELDNFLGTIQGVPTRAGNFSFQITIGAISCPGSDYFPYGDYTMSYTIVTTGN